jgi:hypothetical protein
MANRSYLYSIDAVPYSDANPRRVRGLAEWRYDIPLAFLLLVSANPRACRSMIWNSEDPIAIIGDFKPGFERLSAFLAKAPSASLKSAADEAIRFLSDPKLLQPLILLECGEIYDLEGDNWVEQNQTLLEEIKANDGEIDALWAKARGWAAAMPSSGAAKTEDQKLTSVIGLDGWSTILYFDFPTE